MHAPEGEEMMAESKRSRTDDRANGNGRPALVLERVADIEPTRLEWLWDGLIPRGKVTGLVGDPGIGKSTLTCLLAARISKGRPLDQSQTPSRPESVIMISAEDDAADTIRPRLEAAGADLGRVHVLGGSRTPDGARLPVELSNETQVRELRQIVEVSQVGLVIVDPLMAHLGSVNPHRDSDVRRVLAPLQEIAADCDCAILLVRHLRKGQAARAQYRAMGSIGITGAVRSELLVGIHPEEPDVRVVVLVKSNLAPGHHGYEFVIDGGAVVIEGPTRLSADDLLDDGGPSPKLDRAIEFLRNRLQGGTPQPSKLLREEAKQLGISRRTLCRAKNALPVSSRKVGFDGHWEWYWDEGCHEG